MHNSYIKTQRSGVFIEAKKGSEVALLRAFKVRQAQRGHSGIVEADEDSGPMLDADADAFIHGGFD